MDQIQNLVGTTGAPAAIYYIGATIIGIFIAGWTVSGKVKSICKELIAAIEMDVVAMQGKIKALEVDKLNTDVHNKDMLNVFQMFSSLRDDFKDGFKGVNARIDALLLATKAGAND